MDDIKPLKPRDNQVSRPLHICNNPRQGPAPTQKNPSIALLFRSKNYVHTHSSLKTNTYLKKYYIFKEIYQKNKSKLAD
jgi:hypothetical protein